MKRATVTIAVLISFQVFALQVVLSQDDVESLLEALQTRDSKLMDAPEFRVTFSRETEVLDSTSVRRGAIDTHWTVNKAGSNWAITRVYEPKPRNRDPDSITTKPWFMILRDGEMLSWYSHHDQVIVNRLRDNLNAGSSMPVLVFAGFDTVKHVCEAGGTTWTDAVVDKVMNRFFARPVPTLIETRKETFSSKETDGEVILSSDKETIHLDPSMGFAVTKRIINYIDGKMEVEMHEFEEINDGLWLPRHIAVKRFGSLARDSPEQQARVTAIDHYRVTDFSWVADADAFKITIPEDITVTDEFRGVTYRTTRATDPFRGEFDDARVLIRWNNGTGFWKWVLVIATALCVGFVIAFIAIKKWR